ncbi:MAG: hypothetical protein ACE5HJ_05645 [Thermoplasmata archaeon]
MQLRAGKLYGMTIISADAWQLGKVHISYVSNDWNIPALEIRPERKFANALGLRSRKERERCLLSTKAISSVGSFVLLRTPVAKTADFIIRPDKPPMALPWVLWMPVVSHDGDNLGIVEDAYIDTNIWKVDTLTLLMDRKPYQRLKTFNPAGSGRRIETPSSLAILGDVILLKVRTMELKALLKRENTREYSAAGTPEGV